MKYYQSVLPGLVLKLRGEVWKRLSLDEQERWIDTAFKYWRLRGFPYYRIIDNGIIRRYNHLVRTATENIIRDNNIRMSIVGVGLANSFHPQMWGVGVGKYRSPLDRFNDDEALKGCIRKALEIWPERCSVNESNMRGILKTYSNTASVSNFRPTVAKAIYELYSEEGSRVLDFCAGYGGRLLGCLPLDRCYIGIDASRDQIEGNRAMYHKLKELSPALVKASASLHHACAEEYFSEIESESMSLVFSSPPYFDRERYDADKNQSYIKYPNYENWRKHFLERIIDESYRVLKQGRFLVLNIADVNGIPLRDDTYNICKSRFELFQEYKIQLGNVPFKRKFNNQPYRYESLFVFKKSAGFNSSD